MVVIVSTQPRRLVAVVAGGTGIAISLFIVAGRIDGLVSFVSSVAALAVAGLTVAYTVAAAVEGSIDRHRRQELGERLGRSRGGDAVVGRCSHCLRPQVMAGGLSICPNCDQ